MTALACAGAEDEGSQAQEPGQLIEESGSRAATSHPRFRVQRAIEPPPGSALTTDIPRAQIGVEARTVLAAAPTTVLRWSERVELTGDLELEIELPAELTGARWLRIDRWVSVRNPDLPAETVAQLRTGGRTTLRAEPLILAGVAAAGDGGRTG